VKIEVFDSHGQKVTTVVDQSLSAGDHEIEWDPSLTPHPGAGIYLLKLTCASGTTTKKIIVLN